MIQKKLLMYLFKELPNSINKYIKSLVTRSLVCTTRPEAAIVDGTFPQNMRIRFSENFSNCLNMLT